MEIDVEDKNVVLIVADTLTALHLPCYGYNRDTAPFLTKLAEENLLVKNAYSNAPWTAPSHASLFSGKLPSDHGMTTGSIMFSEHSFVEDLKESGYNTVEYRPTIWYLKIWTSTEDSTASTKYSTSIQKAQRTFSELPERP